MDHGGRERAEVAVERTLTESALAGERVVAIVRIVLCVAVGARAAVQWAATDIAHGHETLRAWITFPALGGAVAFSVATLAGAGRRRPALLLHLSVTVDAVACFVGLLPNALWPGPGYLGTPYILDTAVILLLATASGLRHSVTVAALGAALSAASYAALSTIDHVVSANLAPVIVAAHVMYAILLAAAGAIALIIAVRTRRVVERAARAAGAAEQAGAGLRELLREHHDLRTVITSAQINADLLARRGSDVPATVAHLRDDLDELRVKLDLVKGRAIEELAGLDERQPAAVGEAATFVVAALAPRFPRVTLAAEPCDAPPALVAGGAPTLRRILANLVVNACEGDGTSGAHRVAISARRADALVAIAIEDDGPGLPAHVLATPPGQGVSTKPVGAGFGIGLVDGLVRASGGTVSWTNRTNGGGARVVVELPVAE
jgi:signal transduction histidine kinase